MAATRTRNPRAGSLSRVLLREDFARSTQPLRVDRDAGVIKGVKVVGLQSPNTHGVDGAEDGTVYSPKALREAAPLYEGVAVNVDHPGRARPAQERSSNDRFGKLVNVEPRPDGLYADLHYLKSHPLAERVCEAAERMPELFALSHNAYGKGSVQEGRYVVHEIPEVRSVDLVADGGTNRSLFESQESTRMSKQTGKARKLTEMYEDDMDNMEASGAGEEPGLHDHLGAAILAVLTAVKDGDMSPEEGRKKVLAAYKLATDDGEEAVAEGEGEKDMDGEGRAVEEGDEEGVVSDNEKDADSGDLEKPKKAQESRKGRKAPRGAVRLSEGRAESLCRLAGLEPAAELLESLVAIGDEDKAVRHLTYLKGLAGAKGQRPRTQHVQESRGEAGALDITDGKSFAALLRRGGLN